MPVLSLRKVYGRKGQWRTATAISAHTGKPVAGASTYEKSGVDLKKTSVDMWGCPVGCNPSTAAANQVDHVVRGLVKRRVVPRHGLSVDGRKILFSVAFSERVVILMEFDRNSALTEIVLANERLLANACEQMGWV